MHPADPRAYLSQGCEKRLHFLRIPHDHRKRHSANFLYSAERFWLRASPWTSAPHRCAPSLRKSFQEVALDEALAAILSRSRSRPPRSSWIFSVSPCREIGRASCRERV